MRGWCDGLSEVIDGGFLLDAESIKRNLDNGVEFSGYTKTKMVLDEQTEKWSVVSIQDGSKIITLDTEV